MKKITFTDALYLREVNKGRAEVFVDRVPETVYLNQIAADRDQVLPILNRLNHRLLVDNILNGNRIVVTVNEEGKQELLKFFLPEALIN